ncbi:hypothetical protein [Bacillus cereus]|uniref:hypothetical protein n=1 Tax=Bacillus cereus TaxID=1396 RepID=UPI003644DC08
MIKSIQQSLLETVQVLAGERLKNVSFTKSFTGIVRDVKGLRCIVEVLGSDSECIIPYNLASFVDVDDIVILQDIGNNNAQKIVQGVISSIHQDMFHIYDPVEDRIVSSIEQLWDEELQIPINVVLEIE